MNWLDRTVAYFSPAAGLQRRNARNVLERQPSAPKKRFLGGNSANFGVNTGNPDDARPRRLVSRLTILRLIAENPFAKKGLHALMNSLIGWGITGAPQGSAKLKSLWAEWINLCEYRGAGDSGKSRDLYALQKLWGICMLRDGECFIVPRYVKSAPGTIPLRLQTFDKGMLAVTKVGDNIEGGIELDGEGFPVAYHFYRHRKGARHSFDTVRFAADEVIHLFDQEFVGQIEGISVFDPIVKRLGDIDEGIEAEIVKTNIAACLVGFRYRAPAPDGEDPNIGIPAGEDGYGTPVEELRPGMVETLEDGEQITFSNPPKSGGIGELFRIGLLASAAGLSITYEMISGDLSNVNFSSYRAGELQHKRYIGRLHWLTFIPALNTVFDWFLKAGIDFALLPNRPATCKWTPPPFESLDRKGDAEADILEMESGLESRENLLNSRGFTQEEMMQQIVDGKSLLDKLGIAFKGDPMTPGQAVAADQNLSEGDRSALVSLARQLFMLART
ncbi:MAG: phage portal protein [Sphingobium sp.]